MAIRPSETTEGKLWLANFQPQETIAARYLVDSLRIVSETTFRAALSSHLKECIAQAAAPVAVLPARTLPRPRQPVAGPEESDGPPREPSALRTPYDALPGSEGIVGNVIRDALRDIKAAKWQLAPTLSALREHRARTLIFVDDYSASGKLVNDFVRSWTDSRTVRSWHSFGWIRIFVVLFAASDQALALLNENKWVSEVFVAQQAPDFASALWSEGERDEVERLCQNYAMKFEYALGYGKARGLLAFQHTVPNSLPMILWQRRGHNGRDFTPMFAERQMTSVQQTELADYSPPVSAAYIARSMQKERLADALDQQPGHSTQFVLQVLMATAAGIRSYGRLSAALGLPLASVNQIVGACQRLGLLDDSARLTERGRAELAAVRGRLQLPRAPWELKEDDRPYYPYALREAGGI